MADAVSPEFLALQQALVGRYSLERELGRGGMGMVFLARDVALDRLVAIKLLPPEQAAQAALRERFMREARTAAKLSHPNIVPIFAVEEAGDFVFFVMAYVEGETVGDRLRKRGPLPSAAATRMLQEVAWALAYAHARGIVHRDIKPDNILLEQGTGRALVSDFGIAHLSTAAGVTGVGEVLGTAQYMSPEQACGETVDGRSDLYSLGVVGFFVLSGKLPFDASDVPAMLAMHITKPAPPLASVAPGVPKRLGQAIDRCLAKTPADRFPTGEAFAEAVVASTAMVKEIPAPIRVWLTKGESAKVLLHGWTVIVGLGGLAELASAIFGRGSASFDAWWILAVPWGGFALFRLYHTQRVIEAGYDVDDIRYALAQHAERRREERAFEYDREPPLFARVIRKLTFVCLGAAAAAAIASRVLPGAGENMLWFSFWAASSVATVAGLALGRVFPGRRLPARDTALDYRARIWKTRVGQWIAKFVSVGVERQALPAASAHRPTEVAIGLAADALFAALPKETRKELKDLPDVVRRLEADARQTRQRVEELIEALAGIGEESLGSRSLALKGAGDPDLSTALTGQQDKLRADLAKARDEAAKRLATAVAALENIRLDLLRLKAGAGTVDDLSLHLSAARRLGAEIDAAIAGRQEAEALLKAAEAPPPTPPAPPVAP